MAHALITACPLPLLQLRDDLRTLRLPYWKLNKVWNNEITHHVRVGELGEDLATQFLRKRRHRILLRNYQPPHAGEIDIITREGDVLVFIEVKTRVAPVKYRPINAIDQGKRTQMRLGAKSYLKKLQMDIPYRFDAVEVILEGGELPLLNHIKSLKMDL